MLVNKDSLTIYVSTQALTPVFLAMVVHHELQIFS
jgi:hypothetical protein